MLSVRCVEQCMLGALLLALQTIQGLSANIQEGSRESAILTFEFQNGTVSTALAAMGTFGDQPYARELRCSVLPYSNLLFDCGDDCDVACKPQMDVHHDILLPQDSFCLFLDMQGRSSLCEVYEQALNAQAMGAAAVILLDGGHMLRIPTYPARAEAVDGQANVTIPVVSTLKTTSVVALLNEAAVDVVQGNQLPLVVIDFTSSLIQTDKVEVVLYGTERDLCEKSMGSYCNRKTEFLRMIAGWMVSLAKEGAISFRYRSLVVDCRPHWKDYCQRECTNSGRYCVRRPPMGVAATGADIVKHMAFSECVSKLAESSGDPSLWWEFKHLIDDRCTMVNDTLTLECAEESIRYLGGDTKIKGGISSIEECMGNFDDDSKNTLLENALEDSMGNDEVSEILFDPTFVINGVQYMGRWSRGAWFEAVCAAFQTGREPDLCLDPEISFDECAPGEYGDVMCNLREDSGLTSCRNTFRGFSCECDPSKFITVRNTEDLTAEPECKDKNECLTLSLEEECSCERCACHNTYGSYECESNLPNVCQDQDNSHGGCWHSIIKGKEYSACVDRIASYKERASKGEMTRDIHGTYPHHLLNSCECPEGFEGNGVDECIPICKENPELYLPGAGCVATGKTSKGSVGTIGWITMSICSVILAIAAAKFYHDKRKLGAALDPALQQKLLGQQSGPTSDAIGVGVTSEQSDEPVSPSCPPGRETELGVIHEENTA